jgi:hypothetical protein
MNVRSSIGATPAPRARRHRRVAARGRGLYALEGDDRWALADGDLSDEDVDIYVLRGCAGPWGLLGTATTTDDHCYATSFASTVISTAASALPTGQPFFVSAAMSRTLASSAPAARTCVSRSMRWIAKPFSTFSR